MYFFLPPFFIILVFHSLRSAFKVAEAPSSLLPLGILLVVALWYTIVYCLLSFLPYTQNRKFKKEKKDKARKPKKANKAYELEHLLRL